ncbi:MULTISPECIES: hypothetical protein [Lactobacillus]|uniref:hypothetical protein n=1 Tax=Lactobacillus TaxID=1578 RepID=UPI000CD96309|nr:MULTISPECIES: hypothetical protein [Lactobacillus]RVU77152.1 hypothetical protein EJK20_02350 [Lactobacillus xujianguonis]
MNEALFETIDSLKEVTIFAGKTKQHAFLQLGKRLIAGAELIKKSVSLTEKKSLIEVKHEERRRNHYRKRQANRPATSDNKKRADSA